MKTTHAGKTTRSNGFMELAACLFEVDFSCLVPWGCHWGIMAVPGGCLWGVMGMPLACFVSCIGYLGRESLRCRGGA